MTTNVFDKYSDKLTGVWSLVTAAFYDSEGPDKRLLSQPFGDSPLGKVVIAKSGYLSAILLQPPGLAPVSSGDDWAKATDEEVLRVGRHLTTYGGPMTLLEREDGSLLWHTMVEVANNPNLIGKPQTRIAHYEVEEGSGKEYMTLYPVKWYTLEVCSPSHSLPSAVCG